MIAQDPEAAYKYTMKANTVAVVSDGSAVLGLGNIGALCCYAGYGGKSCSVQGIRRCQCSSDLSGYTGYRRDHQICCQLSHRLSAASTWKISQLHAVLKLKTRLKEILDIPVFHDDQHGTAIVVLAGIINALKVTGKKKEDCRVVVNGAGSAGVAITKLLLTYGFPHITMCDIRSESSPRTQPDLNWMQQKMTEVTNLEERDRYTCRCIKRC